MNVLVLGGDGFIGKWFCDYLCGNGHVVKSFDIKSGSDASRQNINAQEYDQVYFLAWDAGGAKWLFSPKTQRDQLHNNLRLLENCLPQLEHSQFLFVSSQLARNGDTIYSALKRVGELWTGILAQGRSVRLYNAYGSLEDRNNKSHVVSDFIFQALETGVIRMLTRGEEERQFTYISDICLALTVAMECSPGEVYDVAASEWTSVRRIAELIQEETGCDIVAGDQHGKMSHNDPTYILPGWQPVVGIQEGIAKTVADYREHVEKQNENR